MEFYLTYFVGAHHTRSNLTLYVTTRDNVPALFEVSAENFSAQFTAQEGKYTEVTLPTNLALRYSWERDGGVYIHSLNSTKLIVFAARLEQNSTVDSFLVLPLPPDPLQSYTYMAVTRNDEPNSQMYAAALVATDNDTVVEISPKVSIVIGTDTISPNSRYNLTLQRLETLLITDKEDLTGTHIVSNKPLSFFSGH